MKAMQIADLRIENFRGIRTGHIRFGAHTVFIGPNNCGTTIIEAPALLFGRDRMVRSLTEHDFFEGDSCFLSFLSYLLPIAYPKVSSFASPRRGTALDKSRNCKGKSLSDLSPFVSLLSGPFAIR
jgi:hypothetical protein